MFSAEATSSLTVLKRNGKHWLVDSGCTSHLTSNASIFKNIDKSFNSKNKVGNGQYIKAIRTIIHFMFISPKVKLLPVESLKMLMNTPVAHSKCTDQNPSIHVRQYSFEHLNRRLSFKHYHGKLIEP
ncbi:hypothetical protein J1N35_011098 [Gossypium stocksii]|uniref:Retrovirus-related Pol polyprotein from transposon TNT 1-94-like beta-barrel domain-containing protein n=1 Tax=Gossypium stocksii TaxID=47602 RepID=A0A9D3W3D4_9ROSI|nr:hypothetical protein J1N35_011098 [Gossypium stocksii]